MAKALKDGTFKITLNDVKAYDRLRKPEQGFGDLVGQINHNSDRRKARRARKAQERLIAQAEIRLCGDDFDLIVVPIS